jgi:hypothetical protein
MIKYFCDRCGRESEKLYSAEGRFFRDSRGSLSKENIEVCATCNAALGELVQFSSGMHRFFYHELFDFADRQDAKEVCFLAAKEAIEKVADF